VRKIKAILILSCFLVNLLFMPISFSNVHKEMNILCYTDGVEKQVEVTQQEYEYVTKKLKEIEKYGISSEIGKYAVEELIQYLKERKIIDPSLFLKYLEIGKERSMPYEDLPFCFNLFCFVYARSAIEGVPFPWICGPIRALLFCGFLSMLLLFLHGKIKSNIWNTLEWLFAEISIMLLDTTRPFIYSNLVVIDIGFTTWGITFGILGVQPFEGGLLLGFTGIRTEDYELFGFCTIAMGWA